MKLRAETRVRARALQLLYSIEITGADTQEAANGLATLTGEVRLVIDIVEPMVLQLQANQASADALAQGAAENWRFERIALIERNILRIAIHELTQTDLSPRIIIDEALWLAHRFAGTRAPAFINGVLDRIARDLGRL